MSSLPQDLQRTRKADLPALHALDDEWPIGKKAAYFTLGIATLLAAFDFIDRQVLAALLPYIKAEYALSDTQLGFLVSIVNISIAVLVIPSAYIIDRWSRSKMMALMAVIWSVATGACAFAGSYAHLLAARVFVGAGEAGYNPAAQSLLSVSFPRRLRSTALAVLQFGMAIGAPLGLIIGAYVATRWGWRHAFGIVAVPGLVLAVLCLLIRDFKTVPMPQAAITVPAGEKARTGQGSYLAAALALVRTPSLLCVFLAQASMLLLWMMLANWLPSYYNRMAGLPLTTGSFYSSVYLISGSFITLFSGPFWDFLRARWSTRACALLQGAGCALAFVMLLYAFTLATPGSMLQLACIMGQNVFVGTLPVLGYALVMDLSVPHLRATAVSLIVTTQNIFGMALGPLLTGILSDHFDLGVSMAIMSGYYAFAAIMYMGVALFYNRDVARVAQVKVEF